MGKGPVAGVILAAGAGSRMGREKLLLPWRGRPLVAHAVAAAAECAETVLVYRDPAVLAAAAAAGPVRAVVNPDAAAGQASSLRRGLQAVSGRAAAALILLGDQPEVTPATVSALLAAWPVTPQPALAADYGEGWRPPVIVDRSLFADLAALTGDAGARQLFAPRADLLATARVPGSAIDIDTPEQYRSLLAELE